MGSVKKEKVEMRRLRMKKMRQGEDGFYDKAGMMQWRGGGRGGRGCGWGHYHGESRDGGHPIGTLPSNHNAEHPVVSKPPPGLHMPDGRNGFARTTLI